MLRIKVADSVINARMAGCTAIGTACSSQKKGRELMSRQVAIIHGKLIDGNGNQPLENSVLLICNDKIEKVGIWGEISIPEEAEILDAQGKYIIPGLIEGHGSVGGYDGIYILQESAKWGITTVASISGGEDGVRLREAIRANRIQNCAKLLVGGVICSTGGHLKGNPVDGPWEIRRAVRHFAEIEVDFIKTAASLGIWGKNERLGARNYTLEELEALADEAKAWDLKSVVHAHTDPGLHNSLVAGIDQIHHGQLATPEHIRTMREKNLYYMPILKITSQRNYSSWDSRPWMQKKMMDAAPNHRNMVRLAKEMGVKLMVGCIYPGPGDRWICGEGTSFEMMQLQECGLSPMEILVAATKNNAEGYGKADTIGTLEPGKQADLVILDQDPLMDIGVLHQQENIYAVFCDGKEVYHK